MSFLNIQAGFPGGLELVSIGPHSLPPLLPALQRCQCPSRGVTGGLTALSKYRRGFRSGCPGDAGSAVAHSRPAFPHVCACCSVPGSRRQKPVRVSFSVSRGGKQACGFGFGALLVFNFPTCHALALRGPCLLFFLPRPWTRSPSICCPLLLFSSWFFFFFLLPGSTFSIGFYC